LKEYTNLYRGHIQGFEQGCKLDARGTVVPNTATTSAPTVQIKMAVFTDAEHARCVLVQRNEVCYTGSKQISHSVSQRTSPDLTPLDFFLWGFVKDQVFVPPLLANVIEL
jgi:hypothetical protein